MFVLLVSFCTCSCMLIKLADSNTFGVLLLILLPRNKYFLGDLNFNLLTLVLRWGVVILTHRSRFCFPKEGRVS